MSMDTGNGNLCEVQRILNASAPAFVVEIPFGAADKVATGSQVESGQQLRACPRRWKDVKEIVTLPASVRQVSILAG